MRVFIPTTEYRGRTVEFWTWTRSRGLRVTYRDGMTLRSDWGSLPALRRAVALRRETPIREVVPADSEYPYRLRKSLRLSSRPDPVVALDCTR